MTQNDVDIKNENCSFSETKKIIIPGDKVDQLNDFPYLNHQIPKLISKTLALIDKIKFLQIDMVDIYGTFSYVFFYLNSLYFAEENDYCKSFRFCWKIFSGTVLSKIHCYEFDALKYLEKIDECIKDLSNDIATEYSFFRASFGKILKMEDYTDIGVLNDIVVKFSSRVSYAKCNELDNIFNEFHVDFKHYLDVVELYSFLLKKNTEIESGVCDIDDSLPTQNDTKLMYTNYVVYVCESIIALLPHVDDSVNKEKVFNCFIQINILKVLCKFSNKNIMIKHFLELKNILFEILSNIGSWQTMFKVLFSSFFEEKLNPILPLTLIERIFEDISKDGDIFMDHMFVFSDTYHDINLFMFDVLMNDVRNKEYLSQINLQITMVKIFHTIWSTGSSILDSLSEFVESITDINTNFHNFHDSLMLLKRTINPIYIDFMDRYLFMINLYSQVYYELTATMYEEEIESNLKETMFINLISIPDLFIEDQFLDMLFKSEQPVQLENVYDHLDTFIDLYKSNQISLESEITDNTINFLVTFTHLKDLLPIVDVREPANLWIEEPNCLNVYKKMLNTLFEISKQGSSNNEEYLIDISKAATSLVVEDADIEVLFENIMISIPLPNVNTNHIQLYPHIFNSIKLMMRDSETDRLVDDIAFQFGKILELDLHSRDIDYNVLMSNITKLENITKLGNLLYSLRDFVYNISLYHDLSQLLQVIFEEHELFHLFHEMDWIYVAFQMYYTFQRYSGKYVRDSSVSNIYMTSKFNVQNPYEKSQEVNAKKDTLRKIRKFMEKSIDGIKSPSFDSNIIQSLLLSVERSIKSHSAVEKIRAIYKHIETNNAINMRIITVDLLKFISFCNSQCIEDSKRIVDIVSYTIVICLLIADDKVFRSLIGSFKSSLEKRIPKFLEQKDSSARRHEVESRRPIFRNTGFISISSNIKQLLTTTERLGPNGDVIRGFTNTIDEKLKTYNNVYKDNMLSTGLEKANIQANNMFLSLKRTCDYMIRLGKSLDTFSVYDELINNVEKVIQECSDVIKEKEKEMKSLPDKTRILRNELASLKKEYGSLKEMYARNMDVTSDSDGFKMDSDNYGNDTSKLKMNKGSQDIREYITELQTQNTRMKTLLLKLKMRELVFKSNREDPQETENEKEEEDEKLKYKDALEILNEYQKESSDPYIRNRFVIHSLRKIFYGSHKRVLNTNKGYPFDNDDVIFGENRNEDGKLKFASNFHLNPVVSLSSRYKSSYRFIIENFVKNSPRQIRELIDEFDSFNIDIVLEDLSKEYSDKIILSPHEVSIFIDMANDLAEKSSDPQSIMEPIDFVEQLAYVISEGRRQLYEQSK